MNLRRIAPLLLLPLLLPAAAPAATGLVPDPGFVVTPYSATQGAPTSLSFGRDTTDGKGKRLYVADYLGGRILAIDDLGGVGAQPVVFAEGFSSPLGVLGTGQGTVYVADAESAREGPFGFRPYGRVWRVEDTDGDGVADKKSVVLKDLPNGRHNTNGMAIGPDGKLYIANGNATDDGIEGGEAEVDPWSGSVVRVPRNATNLSLADLSKRSALVAHGWRNVYDVAFSPVDSSLLFVPMNGTDDAREGSTGENPVDPELEDSDDLLYATDIDDNRIDDFGFPSCLVNEAEKGSLKPYTTPNDEVRKDFGKCPKDVPRPVSSFGLHVSADGMAFQTSGRWGKDYRNDLFVAEWGSLFGPPTGHQITRVELDKSGRRVVAHHDFLELDLPIDVAFNGGAMYVADFSGTIFKVDKPV
jgi:glucose/arabinose dehydrogenase